jgi:hypothetical protein
MEAGKQGRRNRKAKKGARKRQPKVRIALPFEQALEALLATGPPTKKPKRKKKR